MNNRVPNLRESIAVRFAGAGLILCLWLAAPGSGLAQENAAGNGDASPSLARQLQELRAQVAQLEAALKQQHTGQSTTASPASGSGVTKKGMGGKGMGGGTKKMGGGKGMGGKKMGGKKMGMAGGEMKMGMGPKDGGGIGMGMMGRMKGMGRMKMSSSLPGYPGASHIYHVGASGFFLDHTGHITLTSDQQAALNKIKEEALLAQSTFDRQIEEAEQQLWVLTGSDSPDATKITARVGEIAKLSAEKRIAFIRAVGEAAGILTKEQRLALIGMLPPEHTAAESQTTPNEENE